MRLSATIVLFLIVSIQGSAQEPAKPAEAPGDEKQPVSFWMTKKLEYSQNALVGLTQGNLEQVAKAADQLAALNKVEGFVRSGIPGYRAQLQAFQMANQELGHQARHGKLDETLSAFQQLTTSCVSCHKLLRAQKN